MITLNHFLVLSALLFAIGVFGVLSKRNAIAVLMGVELILNSVNINLLAFNYFLYPGQIIGQVFVLFIMIDSAAEIALGLAIVIALYRKRQSIVIDDMDLLKW